jgi:hypothetical protein
MAQIEASEQYRRGGAVSHIDRRELHTLVDNIP